MKPHPYEDIIHLPHHTSPTRQRMTAENRAAQFAPFSALSGFENVIDESRRETEQKYELDAQKNSFSQDDENEYPNRNPSFL